MNHRIIPMRERFRKRKRMVLFICTGNTCRSPMATGYLRWILDQKQIKDVEVRSAGVLTITGLLASQEAIQVLQAEDIDISKHRSTQLTPELIRKADLILAMSPFHRQTALRISEEARNKTFLLKEFARSDLRNVQIADPMGCTLEVFKKCFKEIKAACNRLTEHDYILGKVDDPRPMTAEEAAAAKKSDTKRKPAKTAKPATKSKTEPVKKKAAAKQPAAKAAKSAVAAKTAAAKKAQAKPAAKPAAKTVTKKSPAKPAPAKTAKKAETPKSKPSAQAKGGKSTAGSRSIASKSARSGARPVARTKS